MFLSGPEVEKFIEGAQLKQVQPAGVDLTVVDVFELDSPGEIDFSNENRKVPKGKKIEFDDKIHLNQGAYRIIYGESVKMPEDAAGVVLPRSSLMRMGATVISALWDPGYEGRGQGLLVIFNPQGLILHRRARVAQLFLIRGKASGKYEGTYHKENL